MKKILFLAMNLILFIACKKESKGPENTNDAPATSFPDFAIVPSDINYPVGTTWNYSITSYEEQYVNISSPNPVMSYSNMATEAYTVTVLRDTIISPSITGKIMEYSGPGFNNTTYIREVSWYEPADLKWHNMNFFSYMGGPESVECFGIDLPLTDASAWQNTHPNHPSSATDSCYALGFDYVSCSLGNIKCIKFKKLPVNNYESTYWYHNIFGRVRVESDNWQISGQTLTTQSSTLILTSFHH